MELEFLIRSTTGECFNLSNDLFQDIFRMLSIPSTPIKAEGDFTIEVVGSKINFTNEDIGIYITFEGDQLSKRQAFQLLKEIKDNIKKLTGQKVEVIQLSLIFIP